MGDADRAVAGDQELRVASPVALERGAVTVVFPAVELDDELGLRPERINLVTEDVDVLGRA